MFSGKSEMQNEAKFFRASAMRIVQNLCAQKKSSEQKFLRTKYNHYVALKTLHRVLHWFFALFSSIGESILKVFGIFIIWNRRRRSICDVHHYRLLPLCVCVFVLYAIVFPLFELDFAIKFVLLKCEMVKQCIKFIVCSMFDALHFACIIFHWKFILCLSIFLQRLFVVHFT